MKLLLIEDDTFLREMYAYVFQQEGVEFDQAEDGQVGIDKGLSTHFDMILLDVMLPKKSGIEVLKELRKPESKSVNTPIILLSNLGQDSVIKEAFNLGADGYMIKADMLPRQVYDKVIGYLNGTVTKDELRKNSVIN
jgi:DNA-binding response OmpR family regulator